MRAKRSRVKPYRFFPRITKRDNEGSTYETYGESFSLRSEVYPASGNVQAEQYGERLNYIYNCRIWETYKIQRNEQGQTEYVFDGFALKERDGISLYSEEDSKPDYQILSIKPYRHSLLLEVERV